MRAPDLLLLDEPTNHLDVDGILWLEGLLRSEPGAYVVVSHDRYFLENVAARMLELEPRLSPRGLFEAQGRYSDFLEKRDELLRGQAAYQESLANTRAPRGRVAAPRRQGAHDQGPGAHRGGAIGSIDELGEPRARGAVGRRRASTSRLRPPDASGSWSPRTWPSRSATGGS